MSDKNLSNELVSFKFKNKERNIIKVIGVGGGGSNAVRNMYEQGVKNVDFVICNTDKQALFPSPIPVKVQLGEDGLGVGGSPEKGKEAALFSIDTIGKLLDSNTRMVFITAGMGGGTGTGAAPVIANEARKKGILTVGVVTLPFAFEKNIRRAKALRGAMELQKNVDSLLIINNEKLIELYADGTTSVEEAFLRADEVLTRATRSIAEIITEEGIVNRDFNDVQSVMSNSGNAIMSVGYGDGDKRILKAINDALNSPLLDTKHIEKAKHLLYIIYTCKDHPVTITELSDTTEFMDSLSPDLEVLFGLYRDENLQDRVRVTIIATGFNDERHDDFMDDNLGELEMYYYGKPSQRKVLQPHEIIQEEKTSETTGFPTVKVSSSWFDKLKNTVSTLIDDYE